MADKLSKRMKEIWNQIEEVSIILASSKEQKQHTSGQCMMRIIVFWLTVCRFARYIENSTRDIFECCCQFGKFT